MTAAAPPAAEPLAEGHLLLSSQACLLLLARSLLLSLAGRFLPCFLEALGATVASLAAFDEAEFLLSSLCLKNQSGPCPPRHTNPCTTEGDGQMEEERGQVKQQVVVDP